MCERPRADVMPATAKLVLTTGARTVITATTSPVAHSASCSARRPAWPATSAAEHAVSYETDDPFSPSAYERRPAAIDAAVPVAAYTLPPAGYSARISLKSVVEKPRNTPVKLPLSAMRSNAEPCNAM